MKYIKYIKLLIVVATIGFTSCDYLDIVPDNVATLETAFKRRTEAQKYLATCYSYLGNPGDPVSNPALLGGDEIDISTYYRDSKGIKSYYIARGRQSPSADYYDSWRGQNGSKNLYQGIRNCNIFLNYLHLVPDMEETEKNQWMAEVKFLKAYYHFLLIRKYGPIPIMDTEMEVNTSFADVKVHRNTIDECFKYVEDLMQEVIETPELLSDINVESVETYGRITKEIALCVKAQVLVYAASPLFNGNVDYAGVKDNRGVEIFCTNKTDEERKQRWEEAAAACKEAIDYCEGQGRELFTAKNDQNFYQNFTPYTKQELGIRGALCQTFENGNPEIIWGSYAKASTELQKQSIPRGVDPTKAAMGVSSNFSVSLNFAKKYYSSHGVPINEDIDLYGKDMFDVSTSTAETSREIHNEYTTANFNFNREPRYYAHLAFDGGVFFGLTRGTVTDDNSTNAGSLLYVSCKLKQPCANMAENSSNYTGIWPKKLVHYKTTMSDQYNAKYENYTMPRLRLSDMYLYCAEALNESGASKEEVFYYLDPIRERGGLKGVEYSWTRYSNKPDKINTIEGRREIVQQERTIELAFEGSRFWDIRRWKTASTELNQPFLGWNILSPNNMYFKENAVYMRYFTQREYLWPIAEKELFANSNLIQNPGW